MSVRINGRKVGPGEPCLFIAEIGINHNGSLRMAFDLIDAAVQAGAEAVKFQKREVRVVYSEAELKMARPVHRSIIKNAMARQEYEGVPYEVFPPENLSRLSAGDEVETTNGDLKYALEFHLKDYDLINEYCLKKGIFWSASAWDGLSAHFVNGFEDVHYLKIASPCLTNVDLLKRVRRKGKPVVLSTGGSTLEQVKAAVNVLGTENLVLLHCVSIYPPKDEDTNLKMMGTLANLYPNVPIGYSSHSTDILAPVAAAGLGATVIEAHLTLDQNLPGSDHKASLTPDQFAEMVREARRLEADPIRLSPEFAENPRVKAMLGDGVKRVLPKEVETMKKLRRRDDLLVTQS